MTELSPEGKTIYSLLHGELDELLDKKLAGFAATLTKSINAKFDAAAVSVSTQINELRDEISFAGGNHLDAGGVGSDPPPSSPSPLASTPPHPDIASASAVGATAGADKGPDGHGLDKLHRGKGYHTYVPPPARGMCSENPPYLVSRQIPERTMDTADVFGSGPRVELPRFDGANPRLWQDRCEDYFQHWNTPSHLWIQYASAQFEGSTARWLEAARRRIPRATWSEFCQHVMNRFGRNQHCTLVRRMFKIHQTTTVTDYVERMISYVLMRLLLMFCITPRVLSRVSAQLFAWPWQFSSRLIWIRQWNWLCCLRS